jgi:hypothetical protein
MMGSQPSSATTTLLQKCIVHVPRGWSQDKLKSFLSDHVSAPYFSVPCVPKIHEEGKSKAKL